MVMFCNFFKGDFWYPFAGQSSRKYGLLHPACSLPIHPHSPQLQSHFDWLLPPSQISWIQSPHSQQHLPVLVWFLHHYQLMDPRAQMPISLKMIMRGPELAKMVWAVVVAAQWAVDWVQRLGSMSSFLSVSSHAPLVSRKGPWIQTQLTFPGLKKQQRSTAVSSRIWTWYLGLSDMP